MKHLPDYRTDKNFKHLSMEDKAYLQGYHAAYLDAVNFFDKVSIVFEINDNVLVEVDTDQLKELKDCFDKYMDDQEIENTVSIFDGADYISEDLELEDVGVITYDRI